MATPCRWSSILIWQSSALVLVQQGQGVTWGKLEGLFDIYYKRPITHQEYDTVKLDLAVHSQPLLFFEGVEKLPDHPCWHIIIQYTITLRPTRRHFVGAKNTVNHGEMNGIVLVNIGQVIAVVPVVKLRCDQDMFEKPKLPVDIGMD